MTITQSQRGRAIPISAAKAAIQKIIQRNPAIKKAVDELVVNSTAATPEDKRDESIVKVYTDNYIFAREVDWKLDDL